MDDASPQQRTVRAALPEGTAEMTTTSAAAARRAAREATRAQLSAPAVVPSDIAARIDGYQPKNIDVAVWATIRPVVVEIVSGSAPTSPASAQHRMLPVAKLAAWAHTQGVPLDPARLLSGQVVEEWARRSIAAGEPTSSIATYRSILRTVATTWGVPTSSQHEVTISRSAGAAPYSAAEDLALRRAVGGQRTPVYRATGCLLYGLSRGGGLSSTALRSLRGTDVVDHGAGGVEVRAESRQVWILEGFCDVVRLGLEVDRGDGWLLAGRDGRRRNIGGYIDRFTVPANTPRLSLARCRATWILDHLNRGTPITVIRETLGSAGLDAIERVVAYKTPVDDDARRRYLRGGP